MQYMLYIRKLCYKMEKFAHSNTKMKILTFSSINIMTFYAIGSPKLLIISEKTSSIVSQVCLDLKIEKPRALIIKCNLF